MDTFELVGLRRRGSVLLSYTGMYRAGTRTRVDLVLWKSLVSSQWSRRSDLLFAS